MISELLSLLRLCESLNRKLKNVAKNRADVSELKGMCRRLLDAATHDGRERRPPPGGTAKDDVKTTCSSTLQGVLK